ncbi:uncharacterized protein LOC123673098 isoform X2 [Harmonia axyridis]|uniref:uncharacterized protein LOC123673098 isoform X2 n=1 Tax=Harmonia axyridis TaxID=115357 RepID=UPI001E2756AE|nr:uncharacterized protein LOC123673098 isoform X2 [Harmonia axyridis]
MMCEGCKTYKSLIEIDKDRFYWTDQLSRTNIELHKKILYLGSYISILEKKIANLNEIILLKDISYASQCIEQERENLETSTRKKNKKEIEFIPNDCLRKLRSLCTQLNNVVDEFQIAKSKFSRILENKEKELNENSNYLQEMVQTYRDNLFKEMMKYNNLKRWIYNELHMLTKVNEEYIRNNVEEMEKKINEKIRSKYKTTLEHGNTQIKHQDELIHKMQIHRRELYCLLKEEKLKRNELKEKYEHTLNEVRMQIRRLKQKNQNMETLLRLQK